MSPRKARGMPADPEQTAELRELHEEFAWKVNAAVAEGREDLIRRYSGEYVEKALRLLTETSRDAGTCGRMDCKVCGRQPLVPPRRPGRWRGLKCWVGQVFRRR
jgi:hypothetical protein